MYKMSFMGILRTWMSQACLGSQIPLSFRVLRQATHIIENASKLGLTKRLELANRYITRKPPYSITMRSPESFTVAVNIAPRSQAKYRPNNNNQKLFINLFSLSHCFLFDFTIRTPRLPTARAIRCSSSHPTSQAATTCPDPYLLLLLGSLIRSQYTPVPAGRKD